MFDFAGPFAPLVTPFSDGGEAVSEIRLARLIQKLLGAGVQGFVVCSDAGEFITTNTAERKQVLEIAMRESKGAPVLAHCTRLGTAQTIDLCQHASRHGARASIVMPPYYGTYGSDEIEQHFRRVAQHAGLPIIVVDPFRRITDEARANLDTLPNLFYATPRAGRENTESDEFVIDGAEVSNLHLLRPNSEAGAAELEGLISRFGKVRLAKAAMQILDIEVGPPRSPVLPLSYEDAQVIGALIQTD